MCGSPLLLGLGRILPLRSLIAILFLEVLEFPESVLLALAELRIGLLDEDNRGDLDISIILDVVELHQVDSVEVETQNCVVVVQLFSQMGVHDEGAIIVPEV
jgi:hypothetical protein